MSATLKIADLNTAIDGAPRMMDLRLAEALGFARPSNIRRIIGRHVKNLKRFGEVCSMVEQTMKNKDNSGGRPGKAYFLNKKQALYICTKSETENATEVTIQMVEVFDAYTTGETINTHKPVHVKEHDRRTSTKIDDAVRLKRNVDRLETVVNSIQPPSHPNFCAMVIDGEHVFVDMSDFDLKGERAAVLDRHGRVRIMNVESQKCGYGIADMRSAVGPWVRRNGSSSERHSYVVIGKVIENGQPRIAMADVPALAPAHRPAKQIDHEGRAAPYRDAIIELIDRGMTNTAIAKRLGCSFETVRRRRVAMG